MQAVNANQNGGAYGVGSGRGSRLELGRVLPGSAVKVRIWFKVVLMKGAFVGWGWGCGLWVVGSGLG
jgi:hypothetical protein